MRTTAIAVLLLSSAAWPCSGPVCEQTFGPIPKAGSTIPANAPALGIQHAQFSDSMWDGGTIPVPRAFSFGLSRSDGGAVSGTRTDFELETWLELGAGLSAGDSLEFATDAGVSFCPFGGDIFVGPAAAIPTTSATIALASTQLFEGMDGGQFCGGPVGLVQHAHLDVQATPEMAPWVPLARWELEVDGANNSTEGYGAVTTAIRTGSAGVRDGRRFIDGFYVNCLAIPDGGATHQVRLLARIVGQAQPIASNTITVSLDCQPDPPFDAGVGPTPDAGGTPDAGEPSTPDGGPDGGTGGSRPPPPSGCGVAPELPMLAILLALLRRSRRFA